MNSCVIAMATRGEPTSGHPSFLVVSVFTTQNLCWSLFSCTPLNAAGWSCVKWAYYTQVTRVGRANQCNWKNVNKLSLKLKKKKMHSRFFHCCFLNRNFKSSVLVCLLGAVWDTVTVLKCMHVTRWVSNQRKIKLKLCVHLFLIAVLCSVLLIS